MDEQKSVEEVVRFLGQKGPQLYRARNLVRSIAAGFVMFVMGLGLLVLFSGTTSLHCERVPAGTIDCTSTQSWFGLLSRERPPVPGLQGADLEQNYDSDDDSYTYRVVLLTSGGVVPLTAAYSSGYERKAEIASEINRFTANPSQQTLDVSTGIPIVGFLVGLPLLIAGPFMAVITVLRGGMPFGRQRLSQPFAAYAEEKKEEDFWD